MPCSRPPLFDPVLPDDLVSDTLARSPGRAAVFTRRGMACPGCDLVGFMTLREAAKVYEVDLEALLDELGEL
jgi:hybrid cluster-associated redox disulfide protein